MPRRSRTGAAGCGSGRCRTRWPSFAVVTGHPIGPSPLITLPPQGGTSELWLRCVRPGIESSTIDLPSSARTLARPHGSRVLRRLNEALPDQMPRWFYNWNIKRILANDVLSARPPRARLVLPPGQQAWAREQSEILVAGLRRRQCTRSSVNRANCSARAETAKPPTRCRASSYLIAAIRRKAALEVHPNLRRTAQQQLTVGMPPSRPATPAASTCKDPDQADVPPWQQPTTVRAAEPGASSPHRTHTCPTQSESAAP